MDKIEVKIEICQDISRLSNLSIDSEVFTHYNLNPEEIRKLVTTGYYKQETEEIINHYFFRIIPAEEFERQVEESMSSIGDLINLYHNRDKLVEIFEIDDETIFSEDDNVTLNDIAEWLEDNYSDINYVPYQCRVKCKGCEINWEENFDED